MTSLGVIGGLGPMATAYLLQLIVEMTDAKTDQEHLDVIIFNRPSIPDRTGFLLGTTKESPLEPMREVARTLETLGACCLAAPCITSHCFYEELACSVSIPFINMVAETVSYLKQNGIQKAGVMATTGTVMTRLFQKELQKQGLTCILPSDAGQQRVMSLIYDNVKAGLPADMGSFRHVSDELRSLGSESIILGCTELSLIKRDNEIGRGYLDALEVLAKRSIQLCGKPVRPEYGCLLSR